MKISDELRQILRVTSTPSIDSAKRSSDSSSETAPQAGSGFKVDISDEGAMIAFVEQAASIAAESTPINQEKVTALKQAIAEGTYRPDYNVVAEKMLADEFEISSL